MDLTCEHEERGGDLWRVFDDFDGSFCRGSFLQFLLFLALLIWSIVLGSNF